MDGRQMPPAGDGPHRMVRTAQVCHDGPDPLGRLVEGLGDGLDLVSLFITPDADFAAVMAEAQARLPGVRVIGCTTAGEIGRGGYLEGAFLAVGFPRANFCTETVVIEDLNQIDTQRIVGDLMRARRTLEAKRPGWHSEFAVLLIDGLSIREDELVAALVGGLGAMPLFGGSAGDGARFESTKVALGGRVLENAAVVTLVRTDCPVRVFSLDHLRLTERRMVVTEADPARRIVRQLNAEPAAREYARLLGKDPEQLSTFTFAAHPVAVRLGGTHHVRAIQRVLDNGDLLFFSAIREGLVLTLAEPDDIAAHLDRTLRDLAGAHRVEAILAFECILRRVESAQLQKSREVSQILDRHKVVGFSTYGEQINGMHVNHTMTGVVICAPGGTDAP